MLKIAWNCKELLRLLALGMLVILYEGESTENLKSVIKIPTIARLSCKLQQRYSWFEEWPTGGSMILHRKMKSLCTFCVQ